MKNTKINKYDRVKRFISPVFAPLLTSEVNDGDEVITRYHSDVELVLSQTRLDNASLQAIISSWRSSSGQDTSRYTDEQLISHIKSRHLQSASEIQSWLNYLDASALNVLETNKPAPAEPSPAEPSPTEPSPTEPSV